MKAHVSSQELREIGKSLGASLPATFFRGRLLVGHASGELALRWAVFADGISRYCELVADSRKLASEEFLEEETWLLSDERVWPFAFASLCEDFGLRSSEIRAVLLAWKRVQAASPFPSWRKAA